MLKVLWAIVLSAALTFCFVSEANASFGQEANASSFSGPEIGARAVPKSLLPKTAFLKQSEFISTGVSLLNERTYFVRYFEDGAWHVKHWVQDSKGWLDTTISKSFASELQAEAFQRSLEKQFTARNGRALVAGLTASSANVTLKSGAVGKAENEVLWHATQTWSWEWEQKYSQWLKENMNADFYKKYNFATDCADVAYSARWIFARIHGLPAANRLGNGSFLTNLSVRDAWKSLPTANEWYQDRRFLAALNYLMDYTYTHTLMRDSYPVAITPQNFLAGVHHLNLHSTSGHTQLVHRVDVDDPSSIPFYVIQSTIPRAVRTLSEALFWAGEVPKKEDGGFLRIRWPIFKDGNASLEDPTRMPGYSLEQYEPGFIREAGRPLNIEVMLRLKPSLDFLALLKSALDNLKSAFEARVAIVEEGYRNCGAGQCPEGSSGYEDWSTPSRDKKILDIDTQINLLAQMYVPNVDLAGYLQREMSKTYLKLDGEDYQLKSLRYAWNKHVYSSDPSVEPGVRWGLAPNFFARALQKDIGTLLEARAQKVEPSNDGLLKSKVISFDEYCAFFSPDQCTRFGTELERPFEALNETLSLKQWGEKISWFNSDPRQTKEIQWGGIRSRIRYFFYNESDKLVVLSSGLAVVTQPGGNVRIGEIGEAGFRPVPLPEKFRWVGFDRKTNMGFAFAPGMLLQHDLKSGKETQFTVPFEQLDKFRFVDPKHWFVASGRTLLSLQVTGAELKIVWSESFDEMPMLEEIQVALAKKDGQTFLYDLEAGPAPKAILLGSGVVVVPRAKNSKNILLLKRTPGTVYLKVNRKSGEVTQVSLPMRTLMMTPNFANVLYFEGESQARLLKLDEDFNEVEKEDLGTLIRVTNGSATVGTGSQKVFLDFSTDSISRAILNSDESFVRSSYKNLLTAELQNGSTRIRSYDGKEVLYEGAGAALLNAQSDARYIVSASDPIEFQIHLLANQQGPALFTGQFWYDGYYAKEYDVLDRGFVLRSPRRNVWIEFLQ